MADEVSTEKEKQEVDMVKRGRIPFHKCRRWWKMGMPCPFLEFGIEEDEQGDDPVEAFANVRAPVAPNVPGLLAATTAHQNRIPAQLPRIVKDLERVGVKDKVGKVQVAAQGGERLRIEDMSFVLRDVDRIVELVTAISSSDVKSEPVNVPSPTPVQPIGRLNFLGAQMETRVVSALKQVKDRTLEASVSFPSDMDQFTQAFGKRSAAVEASIPWNEIMAIAAAGAATSAVMHGRQVLQRVRGTKDFEKNPKAKAGRGAVPSGRGAGGLFFRAPTFRQGAQRSLDLSSPQLDSQVAELAMAGIKQ